MEIEAKFRLEREELNFWRSLLERGNFRDFLPEGGCRSRDMHSFYFDDASGSLSRRCSCIRLRMQEQESVLTVKVQVWANSACSRRHEWEWRFPEQASSWQAALPQLPDFALTKLRSEAAEDRLLRELLDLDRERPLRLCAELRFTRHLRFFRRGETSLEWALDEGAFFHGARSLPFAEMEVELKEGREEGLEDFLKEIGKYASLRPESRSKLERAMLFAEQNDGL